MHSSTKDLHSKNLLKVPALNDMSLEPSPDVSAASTDADIEI